MKSFLYELKQTLYQPFTLMAMLSMLLSPLFGLFLYQPASSMRTDTYLVTMTSFYIGNPSLAAGLFASLILSILMLWQISQIQRKGIQMLIAPYRSATRMHFIQLLVYLFIGWMTTILTCLFYYVPTLKFCGDIFSLSTYLSCYFLCMGATTTIALLFSSSFYALFQRFDLSLIALLLLSLASFTILNNDYLTCWLNPSIWVLSDDFSNRRILLSVAFNRFFWLILGLAVWLLSYLCIRVYEKNLIQSLKLHLHRWHLALLSGLLFLSSYQIKAQEPFLDNSPLLFDFESYYDVPFHENIYLNKTTVNLQPNLQLGSIHGNTSFSIINYETKPTWVRFKLNPGYHVNQVLINGKTTDFEMLKDDEINTKTLLVKLPPIENIECSIEYGGFPQEWEILNLQQGKREISDSYMCLENEVLAPSSFDLNMGEQLFELNVLLPKQLTMIDFGDGKASIIQENETNNLWQLTSFGNNAIVYIGNYQMERIELENLTIDFYYASKHKAIIEENHAYDLIKTVYQFCSKHFGEFSQALDGHLKLVQQRISSGGYAVYGASSIDELDFSKGNLQDKNKGNAIGEVMIHELVHQWWGLNRMFEVESADGWSAEGLTVYTTYRIAKELYGDEYAYQNYIIQWQKAVEELYKNYYLRHPEILSQLTEQLQDSIQAELNTIREYQEMPLKILKAEKLVGGEEKMDDILYRLSVEVDPNDPYLSYEDFLKACNLTKEDLQLD